MTRRRKADPSDKTDRDYEVGYGKPPKSGQFQRGQSGNPEGRKRKDKAIDPAPPDLRPTAKAIREEGLRMITIREGDRREQISTTTAVMRALAVAAVKQGSMAMREYLKFTREEEERFIREKRKSFDSWKAYKIKATADVERARRNGWQSPEPIPHPEDIDLDYSTLTVQLLGPIDEEEASTCERLKRFSELLFQLMTYHGEENAFSAEQPMESKLGLFGLMYWQAIANLPPRLRVHSDEFHGEVERRLCQRTRCWEKLLAEECEALGMPFFAKRGHSHAFSIRELASNLPAETRHVLEATFHTPTA